MIIAFICTTLHSISQYSSEDIYLSTLFEIYLFFKESQQGAGDFTFEGSWFETTEVSLQAVNTELMSFRNRLEKFEENANECSSVLIVVLFFILTKLDKNAAIQRRAIEMLRFSSCPFAAMAEVDPVNTAPRHVARTWLMVCG